MAEHLPKLDLPVLSTDDILPGVYEELRRIARRQRRHMGGGSTLDTTALVHEAYLKLIKSPALAGMERGHFLAIAARAMRQILVDQARRRSYRRETGHVTWTTGFGENSPMQGQQPLDMVALDRALIKLSEVDPRASQTVEWRFFGGLDVGTIANLQGITPRTVTRDWVRACAFLMTELQLIPTADD